MKLIDADALRERIAFIDPTSHFSPASLKTAVLRGFDAAPSIACAADNLRGLVPSKCPTCGETLVPYPCMDLAQDSYRDGIPYGQQHPEWRAHG